ncbi:MAG: hypothetical protein V3T05_13555 [Myxococcota bacterium]
MRASLLVSLLVVAGCAGGAKLVPKGGKVFTAADTVHVAVVDVESPDGPRVLIRITGTMSKLEGKVLVYRLDDSQTNHHRYVTQLKGEEYATIQVKRQRGGAAGWVMYLPEPPGEEVKLELDEARTKVLNLDDVVALHAAQLAEGTLNALQEFSREQRIAEKMQALTEENTHTTRECGHEFPIRVEWETWPEEELKSLSVSSCCGAVISAMRSLCHYDVAKETFSADIEEIVCRRGSEMKLELSAGRLVWMTYQGASNIEEFAKSYLLDEARWSGDMSLARRVGIEQTTLCVGGESRYVGVTPNAKGVRQVIFGDGKKFARVRRLTTLISGDWFFDPREFKATNNENMRGVDLRYYSRVDFDEKKKTCNLQCGDRVIELKPLSIEETRDIMTAAELTDPLPRRVPYAVARDRAGNYFFVDRTDSPGAKDFKLYKGPKGKLEELEMVNIVSDSKGDVFSTKSGSLRLVIEKQKSFWIEGGKTRELVNVPLEKNWGVIYKEIGVYTGKAFGTPCDVF